MDTITVKSGKTGKTYQMPWTDKNDPSDDDIDKFIATQEGSGQVNQASTGGNQDQSSKPQFPTKKNQSAVSKAWDIANTPLTDEIPGVKDVHPFTAASNSLYRYAESGKPLNWLERGYQSLTGVDPRAEGSYAGAYTDALGDASKSMTSPINLALMGAAPVSKAISEVAPIASKTLQNAPRIASGLMAGNSIRKGIRDSDIKQIIPAAIGIMGMRSNVPYNKTDDIIPTQDASVPSEPAPQPITDNSGRNIAPPQSEVQPRPNVVAGAVDNTTPIKPVSPVDIIQNSQTPNGVRALNQQGQTKYILPQDLRGAKPRFNMGGVSYTPQFENDLDKAAYILAQTTPSKRDADFLKFFMNSTGMSEQAARLYGQKVKARIKTNVVGEPEGDVSIPDMFTGYSKASSQPITKTDLANAEVVKQGLASKPKVKVDEQGNTLLMNPNKDTIDKMGSYGFTPSGVINDDNSIQMVKQVAEDTNTPQDVQPVSGQSNQSVNRFKTDVTLLGGENKSFIDGMSEDRLQDFINRNSNNPGYDSPTGRGMLQYAKTVLKEKTNNPKVPVSSELPKQPEATNLSVEDRANLEAWYKFKKIYDSGQMTDAQMLQWAQLHNKVKNLKPNGTVTISPYRFETLPPDDSSPQPVNDITPPQVGASPLNISGKANERPFTQGGNNGGLPPNDVTPVQNVAPDQPAGNGRMLKYPEPPNDPSLTQLALNTPRAAVAGLLHFSAPLRQGALMMSRPQWFQSWKPMFQAFKDPAAFDAQNAAIAADPHFSTAVRDGLSLNNLTDNREEYIPQSLIDKVPYLKDLYAASSRGYTAFFNNLRFGTYSDIMDKASDAGMDSQAVGQGIANYVNTMTGRGKLPGDLNRAANTLNQVFFSPRFMASRIRLIDPETYTQLPQGMRIEALRDLMGFSGMVGGALGLSKILGADVSTDPTNPDFLKIKVGNTRIDATAGLDPYLRLGYALSHYTAQQLGLAGQTYKTSSTSGHKTAYNTGKFGAPTLLDAIQDFMTSKEAPVASFFSDYFRGKDQAGNKFDVTNTDPTKNPIANRFMTITLKDMIDLYRNDPSSIAWAIPSAFGAGVQTYENKGKKSSLYR